MHRAVLEACIPCLCALVACFAALWVLGRWCGARLCLARLRDLHRCEQGGVQSLSLVLTLPFFVMFILFVIQISQLMIGVMVVHYAAFAAARAACVWIPAQTETEPANFINAQVLQQGNGQYLVLSNGGANSLKFQKIQLAAAMACTSLAPSRDLQNGGAMPAWFSQTLDAMQRAYMSLASQGSQQNSRIAKRLYNKLAYSAQNTSVTLSWSEMQHPNRDADIGPSYNPRSHPTVSWNQREVGWEDPLTVWVTHRFALLPGPGRFLAQKLVRADGGPDNVSGMIELNRGQYSEPVYTTRLTASATLVNEGLKSVQPYLIDAN